MQSPAADENDVSSTVALEELERLTIQRVFDRVGGNKEKAGELLESAAPRCTGSSSATRFLQTF